MNMPDATYYPLLTHGPGQCVAIWRDQAVSREVCLAHVRQLAEQLPEARFAINLCNDRYVFMIGTRPRRCRRICHLEVSQL